MKCDLKNRLLDCKTWDFHFQFPDCTTTQKFIYIPIIHKSAFQDFTIQGQDDAK